MNALQERIQYQFKNVDLLKRALSHKSYEYERGLGTTNENNEKLEFLGDAVLDLILSELLMKRFPDDPEGALSKKRASLVNESILALVATQILLGGELLLGKGEIQSGGIGKPRLLASAYEALIGAIFLDGGYLSAKTVVEFHFEELIASVGDRKAGSDDFKTRLQEEVQASLHVTPVYEVVSETGPPHDRIFLVELKIKGVPVCRAEGRSKKSAEQIAAREALNLWKKVNA